MIFRTPRGFVPRKRAQTETCHLAVFLGSGKLHTVRSSHPQQHPMLTSYVFFFHPGGHSSEALALVSALDFSRYTPRTYIVSEGDLLSEQKAVALEQLKATTSSSSAVSASSPLASAAPFTYFLIYRGSQLTRSRNSWHTSNSAQVFKSDTRSSPFPAPGACTRPSSRSRSPSCVHS